MEETLSSTTTSTKQQWIAEQAREHPERVFTSLHHLIDGEWISLCCSPETRAYRAAIFMIVSYVVRSRRDLVRSIGHQDRVGVLELGGEQAVEGVIELNGGPRA